MVRHSEQGVINLGLSLALVGAHLHAGELPWAATTPGYAQRKHLYSLGVPALSQAAGSPRQLARVFWSAQGIAWSATHFSRYQVGSG